jgi:hypothetical protein
VTRREKQEATKAKANQRYVVLDDFARDPDQLARWVNGEPEFPVQGWSWLLDLMVNDQDHDYPGVRWCFDSSRTATWPRSTTTAA